MNHFGSTFILCFLGFLFIQARALPSWKNCTDQAVCEATNEFCQGYDNKCIPCSMDVINWPAVGLGYGEKPSWCTTAIPQIMIDSSSVLTFKNWGGYDGEDSYCPSYDECLRNCRESYTVEKRATSYVLTSTYTATSTCTCDQLMFVNGTSGSWGGTHFGYRNADGADVTMHQIDTNTLDIWIYAWASSSSAEDCGWEYSISASSSAGTGLAGLTFAIIVTLMVA